MNVVPDYKALGKFLLNAPEHIIHHTLSNTSQFARWPMSDKLKKMFKSPFPACNVPRRNEDVATDTVFSDTPAYGGGEMLAQIFVGCKTYLTDVYGLKSQRQFVNALQDQIRERGAMDRLLSDRAQAEISARVKEILGAYSIGDWQSEPYHQH